VTFFVAEYTTPKTKVKLKSDMETIATTASEANDTYVLTEPPPEQQAG